MRRSGDAGTSKREGDSRFDLIVESSESVDENDSERNREVEVRGPTNRNSREENGREMTHGDVQAPAHYLSVPVALDVV